jgi:integrase/recombinase XerD
MIMDIHNYAHQYTWTQGQVRKANISDRNKTFILNYCDACLVRNVCGKVRLIRVMLVMVLYARAFGKDFDQITRTDVEGAITRLLQREPPYSPETLSTYKAIVKRFMSYVQNPEGFPNATPPPSVAWIVSHLRHRDKKRLERQTLLTPADIERVLTSCRNPRDKAFLAMLWETGCRISELGNLQLKNVTKDQYGYLLDVKGKTGHRTPIAITSAPYLTTWLNSHPFPDDPEAPLWVHYHRKTAPVQLNYDTLRGMVIRECKAAGIKQRVFAHLFRHSRATHVLATGTLSESQAKCFFGWTPDSDQLATYAHLLTSDANAAFLRSHGLKTETTERPDLKVTACLVCKELNPGHGETCTRCGNPLNPKSLYEQRPPAVQQEVLANLLTILAEAGMSQQTLEALKKAGLGPTLQQLANKKRDA